MAETPTVAIVMPAYQAAGYLETTVPAARRAARDATVLVVDAGSTDDSGRIARELGAEVVTLPHRAGPAEARNAGVAALDGVDIALFVDSDCVAHEDIVDRVRRAFAAEPELVTLTGSYDSEPGARSFFSDYMNLRHHHTHQHARRVGATFWSGCGAVRVEAFRAVGGFDQERFPTPMVEDIELGLRLRELGTTRLDPDLNVKHLKRWTGWSVVTTDIFCRAVPWTQLILDSGELPTDLNLSWAQRLAAPVAPFTLLAVVALPILAVIAPAQVLLWLPPLAGCLALSWWLSRALLATFWRLRGPLFAISGWLFHQVHLLYSAATFATMVLRHKLGRQAPVAATRPDRGDRPLP